MSEDQKPEPIKDENGVPWCDTGCRHYNDVPYHQIEGDRSSCALGGSVHGLCKAAVREMVAELEQCREAVNAFLDTWKRAGPLGSGQFEKFDQVVRLCQIATRERHEK